MIVLANVCDGLVIKQYPFMYIIFCALLTLTLGWAYRFVQIRLGK